MSAAVAQIALDTIIAAQAELEFAQNEADSAWKLKCLEQAAEHLR